MRATVKAKSVVFQITLDDGLEVFSPDGDRVVDLESWLSGVYQLKYSPALGHPLGFYAQELARLLDGEVASVELGEEPEGMIY
jgi:hypothetical protein